MIAALTLGLMGSLHCAGMCGPLVLMTPVAGNAAASRLVYHSGRLLTYALIGAVFGVIGESVVLAGLQRWLSIMAGLLMIGGVFLFNRRLNALPLFVKRAFGKFLHQRTYPAIFALGATNGLLPCGLVYVAAAASIASGSILASAAQMIVFGMGTLPMLLAISIAGQRAGRLQIPGLRKLAPITVAVVACLLIARGQPLALAKDWRASAPCPACVRHAE